MSDSGAFVGLELLENRTLLSATLGVDGKEGSGPGGGAALTAGRARASSPKLPKAYSGVFTLSVSGTDAVFGTFAFKGTFTVNTRGADYLVTDTFGNSLSGTIPKWNISKVTDRSAKVTAISLGTASVLGQTRLYNLIFDGKFKTSNTNKKKFTATVTGKEKVSGLPVSASFVAKLQ